MQLQVGFSAQEGGFDAFIRLKNESEFIHRFFSLTLETARADEARRLVVEVCEKHARKPEYQARHSQLTLFRGRMSTFADAARTYLQPDGSVYQPGERLRLPELAGTLQRLADAGGDDFYSGDIAREIAADLAEHGGLVTADDLGAYEVYEYPPLRAGYRGLEVTTSSAPSSGPQLLQLLQILDHFDLAALRHVDL